MPSDAELVDSVFQQYRGEDCGSYDNDTVRTWKQGGCEVNKISKTENRLESKYNAAELIVSSACIANKLYGLYRLYGVNFKSWGL